MPYHRLQSPYDGLRSSAAPPTTESDLLPLTAPRDDGVQTKQGHIVVQPDPYSRGKRRPWVRIDPTPGNPSREQLAFPFADEEGVYLSLSESPNPGSVPLPGKYKVEDRADMRPRGKDYTGPSYADPYSPIKLKNRDIDPDDVIGLVDESGRLAILRAAVNDFLSGGLKGQEQKGLSRELKETLRD